MPEPQPGSLDERLGQARTELLAQIRLPELSGIQHRAGRIRRRRQRMAVGSSALALLIVVLLGTSLVAGGATSPEPAASPATAGPVWAGQGITLHGLTGQVLDQPGDLVDVRFASTADGYALTEKCDQATVECLAALAVTMDAGDTWTDWPLPFDAARAGTTGLVPLGRGLVVQADGAAWLGEEKTRDWIRVTVDPAPARAVADGAALTVEPVACGGSLTVWQPDGTRAALANPPPMTACSVTASGGDWWVGGRRADGSAPAVAVSRDHGATWQVHEFPASAAVARVTAYGGSGIDVVLLVARGGDPYPETQTVTGVYRFDGVDTFRQQPIDSGPLIGDLVALPDGRWLAAGPDWQLCEPDGLWHRAGGSLPWVRRFVAIPGGWVAYDLFRAGWVAWSTNGTDWQKINVR